MSESNKVVLLRVNTKKYIPGVPVGDLTEEDMANLPDAVTKKSLLNSGIYKAAPKSSSRGKAKVVPAPEPVKETDNE